MKKRLVLLMRCVLRKRDSFISFSAVVLFLQPLHFEEYIFFTSSLVVICPRINNCLLKQVNQPVLAYPGAYRKVTVELKV